MSQLKTYMIIYHIFKKFLEKIQVSLKSIPWFNCSWIKGHKKW